MGTYTINSHAVVVVQWPIHSTRRSVEHRGPLLVGSRRHSLTEPLVTAKKKKTI